MGIKHTIQKRKVINLSITAFFAVSVLLPILSMFTRITPEAAGELVDSRQFTEAVYNSSLYWLRGVWRGRPCA